MIEPNYYDAYLAIGVENYLFSLKPAPVRWILQAGGAETDRDRGVEDLRLTAEKGRYLVSLRAAAAGRGGAAQQGRSQGARSAECARARIPAQPAVRAGAGPTSRQNLQ